MITSRDILTRIHERLNSNYSIEELEVLADSIFEEIIDAVSHGEDVHVRKFGRFIPKFVSGRVISKSGIAWMKGKTFVTKNRFRLGLIPFKYANDRVNTIKESLPDFKDGKPTARQKINLG